MKVTNEMIRAYAQADTIDDGIQAVLDLIDPVPADVNMITDADGSDWWRPNGYDPTVWQLYGVGRARSIMWIQEHCGPITWEGKPSE